MAWCPRSLPSRCGGFGNLVAPDRTSLPGEVQTTRAHGTLGSMLCRDRLTLEPQRTGTLRIWDGRYGIPGGAPVPMRLHKTYPTRHTSDVAGIVHFLKAAAPRQRAYKQNNRTFELWSVSREVAIQACITLRLKMAQNPHIIWFLDAKTFEMWGLRALGLWLCCCGLLRLGDFMSTCCGVSGLWLRKQRFKSPQPDKHDVSNLGCCYGT